ncbi:AI-2E family transporter [Intrasporangium sp.]|uniref:AI-2E family transporter n=1 Tax=Intrasporangium sp. TaxID=1925024 RepID=UPI0032216592
MWRRWTDYRRAQRQRLAQIRDARYDRDAGAVPAPEGAAEPDRSASGATAADGASTHEPVARTPDGGARADDTSRGTPGGAAAGPARAHARAARAKDGGFGPIGTPFNRQSPFYVGFIGALGVLVAYAFVQAVGKLGTTITLLVVALFLTLALNPLVEALTRTHLRRGAAVAVVFLGVLVVFGLLGWVVIPPVAQQSTELATNAPKMLDGLLQNGWVQDLDHRYQVIARIQEEVNKRVADGNLWAGIFGGVLETGKVLLSGVFSVLTVLVLTLYFLASLPSLKHAGYALVPASRRPRITSLAEEIMRRVGSYAIGQVAVASINAFFAWIMMTLVGVKFAAVLAVAVGFLGLIPMVGATLGASVVALVALFDDPQKALIVIIYFIVYQQIENYAVMPRVMQQTVAVPGAVTVVAALAGGTLAGILGALLAIPTAAGLLLIYEEVLVPRQRQQ